MEQELLHFVVCVREARRPVGHVLRGEYGMSKKLLTRLKQEGSVRVNGEPARLSDLLAIGDQVSVILPPEEAETLAPEPMPLAIRYEDEDLLVLAKPPGLVVHPTRNYPSGTLANGVVAYWQSKGEPRKFRPVNRLDKDTSGLLLVAKHQWAHKQCARMQRERTLRRTYQAVVEGIVREDEGVIDAPIGLKDTSIIEREVRADGQPAVTCYRVLARGAGMTWVELSLLTGRTHQIRVHLSHLGHPLAGDELYGGSRKWIGRQALHACRVDLPHPRTGEPLCFTEPLPADMSRLTEAVQRGGDDSILAGKSVMNPLS